MQRPVGVTIIAVLCFIGAALALLAGLACIVGGAWLAALASHRAASLCATCLGSFRVVGCVLMLGLAALSIATGVGLLGLKSWARILALILVVLGLAVNVILILGAVVRHAGVGLIHHHHLHMIVVHLVWLAIGVWILYYLFRPNVKRAFGVS